MTDNHTDWLKGRGRVPDVTGTCFVQVANSEGEILSCSCGYHRSVPRSPHQVWLLFFMCNLALPPFGIVMFLIQDNRQHLYVALFSSLLAYMGLWIGERIFR